MGNAQRKTVVHPVPRTWLANPNLKPDPWRSARPAWREAETAYERVLLEAAQDHHRVTYYLRRYRDANGLLNEDIAKAIGRHTDHVSAIMRGNAHVSLTDLHLIAAALNAYIQTIPTATLSTEPARRGSAQNPSDTDEPPQVTSLMSTTLDDDEQ